MCSPRIRGSTSRPVSTRTAGSTSRAARRSRAGWRRDCAPPAPGEGRPRPTSLRDRPQAAPDAVPGLSSFGDEDADAALFYGRSREIADALEEIRKVRAERDLRPFVILGASGSGKSSLLKAGVIPRLRREAPAWLPLRAFRPGADPLLNFAEALARTFGDFGKVEAHGVIRDRLIDAWRAAERADERLTPGGLAALESALEAEGRKLRAAAGRGGATILVSVDQAEEMARADGDSGEALADYLRAALAATASRWQLAFTIRTDSFPELQSHRRFQDLKARGYDLRAVPVFRFDSVVEEPAKRYGVEVDNALVDALMDDAPKEDALPLLAFALQRLWRQYAASGALVADELRPRRRPARAHRGRRRAGAARPRAGRGRGAARRPADQGADRSRRLDLRAGARPDQRPGRHHPAHRGVEQFQRGAAGPADPLRPLAPRRPQGRGGHGRGRPRGAVSRMVAAQRLARAERARLEALRSLQTDALTWDRAGRDAAFLNHRGRQARRDRGADRSRILPQAHGRGGIRLSQGLPGGREEGDEAARAACRRSSTRCSSASSSASSAGSIRRPLKAEANWFFTERPYMLASVRPYVLTADAERALKPLASFRECAENCPEMIVVPAGEFLMGSPATEPGRQADEGPQHKVTIARPFAVSKFDVTFADWDACVAVGECPDAPDGGWGHGARPAINVSLGEARKYVAWLSAMTGRPYRLLTEAEWEYAARAGSTTAYFWGDAVGEANANCIGCGSPWDGRETSPAGAFKPNAFGLYDMAGDVWQFVQDCPHDTYDGAPSDGSVWAGGDCSRHSVRGGSSNSPPQDIRSARRYKISTDTRDTGLGFRVARTLLGP